MQKPEERCVIPTHVNHVPRHHRRVETLRAATISGGPHHPPSTTVLLRLAAQGGRARPGSRGQPMAAIGASNRRKSATEISAINRSSIRPTQADCPFSLKQKDDRESKQDENVDKLQKILATSFPRHIRHICAKLREPSADRDVPALALLLEKAVRETHHAPRRTGQGRPYRYVVVWRMSGT